jgi:hypothetical protein
MQMQDTLWHPAYQGVQQPYGQSIAQSKHIWFAYALLSGNGTDSASVCEEPQLQQSAVSDRHNSSKEKVSEEVSQSDRVV